MGFKEEFEKARKAGKTEFTFKGKKFNTLREGETKKEWKEKLSVTTKDKDVMKKLKSVPKKTDKHVERLDTQAKRFAHWLKNKHGDKVRITSLDRGKKSKKNPNHHSGQAFDAVFENLNEKETKEALKEATKFGLRVGDETRVSGKGRIKPHWHFDELEKGEVDFTRGKFSEGASKKSRNFWENAQDRKFVAMMKELRKEGRKKPSSVYGPLPPVSESEATLGELREKESPRTLSKRIQASIPKEYGKPTAPKPQPAFIRDEEMEALAKQDEIEEDIDPEVEALEDQEKQYVYEEAQREFPLMDTGVRLAMRQKGDEGAIPNKSFGELLSKKKKEEDEFIPEGGVPVKLSDEEKAQLDAPELQFDMPKLGNISLEGINQVEPVDETSIAQAKKVASEIPVEEERGVSDQFKEAMSFFAPALLGGVIGGIFEGGAGAQAGIETGHSLGQAFRKHQDVQEDRKLRRDIATVKAGKKDIGTFVDSKTGNPIYYDKGSNKFKSIDGAIVPQNRAVHATTYRQTRSIGQRQAEEQAKQSRFEDRFQLDKQKLAQLSNEQVNQLKDFEHVLDSIDTMASLKGKVDTGIIANAAGSMLELFDAQPKNFTELKSASNDSLAKYVKSISGAQVSELEAERLGQIIPTTADNDETFKKKLKMFKKIVESNKGALQRAIKAGQPLKKLIGLDEAIKDLSKKKQDFSREEIDAMKERIRKERQGQ